MKQYLKFKKWAGQEKIQRMVNKLIIGWIVIILIFAVVLSARNSSLLNVLGISTQVETISTPTSVLTPTDSPTPIPTYVPTQIPKVKPVYVDPDPIVNCGPGQISKQYIKDRSSNCKNYVDCGFNKNTVYTLMLKTECDKRHAEESSKNTSNNTTNTYKSPYNTNPNEITCSIIGYSESRKVWTYILTPAECDAARANYPKTTTTTQAETTPAYPPCTVYYSALKSSSTFNYMSPEECKTAQDKANSGSVQNYDSAIGACLNRARAAGAASSSWAEACYSNPNLGL